MDFGRRFVGKKDGANLRFRNAEAGIQGKGGKYPPFIGLILLSRG